MGKARNSYHMMDDSSYELLQQFEPAIEIPSDDEIEKDTKPFQKQIDTSSDEKDTKPEISPKLHQRLMESSKRQRDTSPTNAHQNSHKSQKSAPKLRAIPQLNLMDIHNLISRSTGGETTISPAPLNLHNSQAVNLSTQQQSQQQASSSNPQHSNNSSYPKRRRTDEVTTTACGASSNDEFPSESGNFPTSSNDDDYHFLMSLQPYMTQFTGPQKLRIRMRIQKLIFKELYKDELDE